MAIRINSNPGTMTGLNNLRRNQADLTASLERIGTGNRINKAADDASGLFIADGLGAQARGFGQAIRNANDTISITQIADGALGESANIINDIRTKALQAANGSQSAESRAAIQADITQKLSALDDVAQNTTYNGQQLLSGGFTDKVFQIGASSGDTVSLSIDSAEAGHLGDSETGTLADIDVTTQEGAETAIAIADAALEGLNANRSNIGSTQNQVESTLSNLQSSRISALSAESSIRDVDLAEEAMNNARLRDLAKANTFAVAQGNALSKNVLNVLGVPSKA